MSLATVQDGVVTYFTNDTDISNEFETRIKKGLDKNAKLSDGPILRVVSFSTADLDGDSPGHKARTAYHFIIVIGFIEPNDETAETRKSTYDKVIRNAIDKDPTFNGVCVGNTEMGKMTWAEHPEAEGTYFSTMPLFCYKDEIRGAR